MAEKGELLRDAAIDGDVAQVRAVLDGPQPPKGAQIDYACNSNTALGEAARGGHMDVVKLLLDRGANVNAKGRRGDTALILAAGENQVPAMELLLARGADASIKDDNGNTATAHARSDKAKRLLQVGELFASLFRIPIHLSQPRSGQHLNESHRVTVQSRLLAGRRRNTWTPHAALRCA
jgi:uncharacterized protein